LSSWKLETQCLKANYMQPCSCPTGDRHMFVDRNKMEPGILKKEAFLREAKPPKAPTCHRWQLDLSTGYSEGNSLM